LNWLPNLRFSIFTKYSNETASIAQPEDFKITDDIYKQFQNYVKSSDFHYDSESLDEFNKLMEAAKKEKYYSISENEFNALKAKLEPNLDKDLNEFRGEISDMLKDEIVSRYYYQKGSIRAALKDDIGIKKAIDALHSETAFAAYFKPGTIINMN